MNDAANASGAPLVLGSPVSELTEHWSGAAYVPGDWRETASFYRADRERVLCIGKQVWKRDDAHPVGLGMFYPLLTQALFPGEGNEGKVTDLAPHGDAHAMHLPPLAVEAGQVHIPAPWRAVLRERERFRYGQPGVAFVAFAAFAACAACADLAAAGQRAFEEALLAVARWLHAQTGLERLCFAGGTALNGRANERLLRETPFNGKDEPIVETPSEALAAFCRMPLHALALPPFLVTKRSEPELPA